MKISIALSSAEDVDGYHRNMATLVLRLFDARTVIHLMHLSTRSYASHKALNDFYDGILDLADGLAEAFQGQYGIITKYPVREGSWPDLTKPSDFLGELEQFISGIRDQVCDTSATHLQNIIDEVVALVQSTQYKLKFLS